MKFRQLIKEEIYSDSFLFESWKAGIDQSYTWETIGMQRRNVYRWMVQQKGFSSAFNELKRKKEITTSMLKPFGMTMNTFLTFNKTNKEIRDYVIEKFIKLFEKAIKEVKDSYPYQLLGRAKIPYNKDLGYVVSQIKMPTLSDEEKEKLKEITSKKKSEISHQINWG